MIMVLAVVLILVGLVGGFLYAASVFTLNSGWEETDARALWLAEAGSEKAIWYLMTPVGGGGRGENWTTAGTTENLGSGTYRMVVERWDFSLSANGSTASASSSNGANVPARAIDGNDVTFWESRNVPSVANPQFITITFPYTLTINKVRFLASTAANRPRDYTWQVSTDNVIYTTVVTVINNALTNVTNTFNAQSNVNYLRLRVTRPGSGGSRVRVATLEAIGSRVTSTGTVQSVSRTVRETVVADDGVPQNQVSFDERDWDEL